MYVTRYFYGYNDTNKFPSSKMRRIINYHPSNMVLTRCFEILVLWHTNWSCFHFFRVRSILHVPFSKKVIGDKLTFQTILKKIDKKEKIILKPEAVTETRTRQVRSISKYPNKWKKFHVEDSTWEDENFIQKHPQILKLWG